MNNYEAEQVYFSLPKGERPDFLSAYRHLKAWWDEKRQRMPPSLAALELGYETPSSIPYQHWRDDNVEQPMGLPPGPPTPEQMYQDDLTREGYELKTPCLYCGNTGRSNYHACMGCGHTGE